MKTFASLFTGGGLADAGAISAGLSHLWGVEWDERAHACAVANGLDTILYDVRALGRSGWRLPRPDWLHASPPCTRASVSKRDRGETRLDTELAESVLGAVRSLSPPHFSLENVEGYQGFRAFAGLASGLSALGYRLWVGVLNAADFGVPQRRRRLWLLASLEVQPRPPSPTHSVNPAPQQGSLFGAPPLLPRLGWSTAVPSWELLPRRPLPDWMRRAGFLEAFPVLTSNASSFRSSKSPASPRIPDRVPPHLPAPTLRCGGTFEVYDGEGLRPLGPRDLAAIQTAPAWWEPPEVKAHARLVCGNGVPSLLMRRIIEANS